MSTWLDAWRRSSRRAPAAAVVELLVVAGADAGNVFTLEGDEILIGRGQPESGRTEQVRLSDRSISRRQAWIRRSDAGTTIEHIESASNPTLLNGRAIGRAPLEAGDRIEMGRVAIDVRAREGINLRGLTQIMEAAARESTRSAIDADGGTTTAAAPPRAVAEPGSRAAPGSAAASGSRAEPGSAAASGSRAEPGAAAASGARAEPGSAATSGSRAEPGSAATSGSRAAHDEDTTASPATEPTAAAGGPAPPDASPRETGGTAGAAEATDVRPMAIRIGELTWLRGAEGEAAGTRFPVFHAGTTIGRGEEAGVRIPERGVSRLHAELALTERGLVLRHRSGTNPTLVNGLPVVGEVPLEDGDEIQLADRVVLALRLDRPARRATPPASLSRRMERKIDLDREIAAYNVMGSFLDVDVVSSRAMKGPGEKAEHIIVSFERFRAYVAGICHEWNGQVLNSNGDELMCFFESAASAVLAGSAILERLERFNLEQNLLGRPFRFRLGVHTGVSLVDLDAGVAYSEVLDTAGHIQKRAEPDSLLLSQSTLDALPGPIPVTPVDELSAEAGGDARLLYRLDGFLSPADYAPRDEAPSKGASAPDGAGRLSTD